jgi:hypothetical protein
MRRSPFLRSAPLCAAVPPSFATADTAAPAPAPAAPAAPAGIEICCVRIRFQPKRRVWLTPRRLEVALLPSEEVKCGRALATIIGPTAASKNRRAIC